MEHKYKVKYTAPGLIGVTDMVMESDSIEDAERFLKDNVTGIEIKEITEIG